MTYFPDPSVASGDVFDVLSIRDFGAVCDGVTDDYPAIAAALAHGGRIFVPAVTVRCSAGITIPAGSSLIGEQFLPGNPADGSVLFFDATVSPCVTLNAVSPIGTASLRSITVTRAGGTPATGLIGVSILDPYLDILEDVNAVNHGVGYYLSGGIAVTGTRVFSSAITDAHLIVNSTAEIRFSQCRFGINGGGDYAANTYLRFQGGVADTAGGPNTVTFDNCQFNQGAVATGHWLEYVNLGAGGVSGGIDARYWRFNNCHVENVSTAYIYSDSSWDQLSRFSLSNSELNSPVHVFALNAATSLYTVAFSACYIAGPISLSPAAMAPVSFVGCNIANNITIGVSSASTSILSIIGNSIDGTLTVTGTGWLAATLAGNGYQSSPPDVSGATGNISVLDAAHSTFMVPNSGGIVGTGSAITVTPTGGTTARTLATWFADVANLLAFGADPTGTTDSTAAFTSFMTAVLSSGGSGFMPAGTYALTGPLTIDLSAAQRTGARIVGAGGQNTVLNITNITATAALTLQCSAGASFYFDLQDFAIKSNCAAPTLQIGRNLGVPANLQSNYPDAANSWRIQGLIVNNLSASPNAQALQINGMYNCEVFAVCNCAGHGTSLRLNQAQFTVFKGSYSGANIGIDFEEFYSFANTFLAVDLEVVNTCVQFNVSYATANTFIGGQFVYTNGSGPAVAGIVGNAGSNNRFIGCNIPGSTPISDASVGVQVDALGYHGMLISPSANDGAMTINSVAANSDDIVLQQAGVTRWQIQRDTAANLKIERFSATGVQVDVPIQVSATTGATTITNLAASSVIATGSTTARTLAAWAADLPTPFSYGALGDGVTDDTAALNSWLAAGGGLLPNPPGPYYKITGTLVVAVTNTSIIGQGAAALIQMVLPSGTAVVPAIDLQATASGSILEDFAVNHNAASLIANTVYGANVIAGGAILVQANNVRLSRLTVSNAFDNGISIVQLSASGGVTSGSPQHVQIAACITNTCGVGSKTGDGIDIGSGSDCIVSDCNDIGSAVGFGLDYGAGASASFTNCHSVSPTNYGVGSGYGYYVGSTNSTFVNCQSSFAARDGFWIDAAAQDVQFIGCQSLQSSWRGFYMKSSANLSMIGCVAKNASFGNSGTYDAFLCDNSAGAQTNIQLIGCGTLGSTHNYGYNETGSNGTSTLVLGGTFNGISGTMPATVASASWTVPNGATVLATGSTTARSLAARAADAFNLLDYFATGDTPTYWDAAYARVLAAMPTTGGLIRVPVGNYNFISGIGVPPGVALVGDAMLPGNPAHAPYGARFIFASTVPVCVSVGTLNSGGTARIEGIFVDRAGAQPSAGAGLIGVKIVDGYAISLVDVKVSNHSVGYYLLSYGTGSGLGLGCMATRIWSGAISDAHIIVDSWPEFRVSQSRFGMNGLGDVACNTYVRYQGGYPGSSAGPNTVTFDNCQFNQGSATVTHWLEFVELNGSVGSIDAGDFRFDGCHVEAISGAFIYSDATWNPIRHTSIDGCTLNNTVPMFALNAASGLSDVEFNDCYIGGSLTLICNYVSSFAVTNSDVNGAFSLSPTTPSNSTATISGVAFYSTVTVGGTSWLSLNCIANSYRGGLPTITATGNINWLDAQVANVLLPGTILPNTDNTYNLGSLAYRFANFYTAHVNIRSNTDAALAMWAGGATTDQKYADITTYTSGSTSFLEFRLLNDTYLSANVWLSVGRTGYVPTSINFSAPSLTNTGAIAAWGHTAPIFQPTITGSRSGATVGVLTALITALAATGLIVDGTTP